MSIPKVSIRQIKAARALLGWSQEDLAIASKVSLPTVKRLEATDGEVGGRKTTSSALISSLEAAGVAFVGSAGVRLKCVPVQSIGEWRLFDCYEGDGKPKSYFISRMEERNGVAVEDLVSPKTGNREEAERWASVGNWQGTDY